MSCGNEYVDDDITEIASILSEIIIKRIETNYLFEDSIKTNVELETFQDNLLKSGYSKQILRAIESNLAKHDIQCNDLHVEINESRGRTRSSTILFYDTKYIVPMSKTTLNVIRLVSSIVTLTLGAASYYFYSQYENTE